MTISIAVPGVTFTKYVSKVLLPFIEEAAAYNLYGGDAASSKLNRAINATVQSLEIGTPIYGAGFVTASNINGFNTGLLLDAPYTQIVISQNISGTGALIGRGNGADSFVDMLTSESNGVLLYTWPDGNKANGLDVTASFALNGASWGGGNKSAVFSHNGNNLNYNLTSVNIAKTITPTSNMRIGASYGGFSFNIAASVFFPRELTPAEIVQVYAYLKPLLATRGVTIL